MMRWRALLLRYSDAEFPSSDESATVPIHIAAIRNGKVWWGWWKKGSEPFDSELLTMAHDEAIRGSITVGLLNRKDGNYWTATCTNIVFEPDGAKLPAPDRDAVPEYYRDDSFPAWFELSNFRQVDLGEFQRLFGPAPSSDPTVYLVTSDDGREISIRPKPEWSMTEDTLRTAKILHISDLHFGPDHNYPIVRVGPPHEIDGLPLVDIISGYLDSVGSDIGLIVVTGDLTTGKPSTYQDAFPDARNFLATLADRLGLDPNHTVVIPGNHDIRLGDYEHPAREFPHEAAFREFLRSFYLKDHRELERIYRFHSEETWDLTVFALNSVRLRTPGMEEYGYVGAHRYLDMLEYAERTLQQKTTREREVKIALLHHHLLPMTAVDIPEPERPVSLTLDAGELLEHMQLHGVRLALHGHQHSPFLARTSRAYTTTSGWEPPSQDVIVIGMGSTGSRRLPTSAPWNYFGVYELHDEGVDVSMIGFLPNHPPEPHLTTRVGWSTASGDA